MAHEEVGEEVEGGADQRHHRHYAQRRRSVHVHLWKGEGHRHCHQRERQLASSISRGQHEKEGKNIGIGSGIDDLSKRNIFIVSYQPHHPHQHRVSMWTYVRPSQTSPGEAVDPDAYCRRSQDTTTHLAASPAPKPKESKASPISGSLFQLLPSRPHMAHGGAEFLVFSFHERERGTVRIDVQTEVPPSLVPPDEYSTKRLLF